MAVLRLTAQCHINRDLHLQAGSFDPQHFPEWLHLLVSLSAAVCSPALMAAIPGASNIDHLETQHWQHSRAEPKPGRNAVYQQRQPQAPPLREEKYGCPCQ